MRWDTTVYFTTSVLSCMCEALAQWIAASSNREKTQCAGVKCVDSIHLLVALIATVIFLMVYFLLCLLNTFLKSYSEPYVGHSSLDTPRRNAESDILPEDGSEIMI